MRSGSLLWLLHHDLRIGWRDARGGFGRLGANSLLALAIAIVLVVHAGAWGLAGEVGAMTADGASRAEAERLALPFAGFVLLLLLAQALNGSAKLLYARGDLDLLFSSPTEPRRVLAARALAVALGALASAAVFTLPIADDGLLLGHPRLLALYPALAGGALLAGALGLATTLALFRLLGPRRTRLAAQVLATAVGAGFVLALQIRRLLPGDPSSALLGADGWLRAALLLPVRAGLGDPGALAAWLTGGMAAFALAVLALGPAFARGTLAAPEAEGTAFRAAPRRPSSGLAFAADRAFATDRAFAAGPLAGLRRKEWRLMLRDPWLVSQVLLQVVYMLPLAVLLWTGSGDPALGLAPAIVVVLFQLCSSLTWLGLSGEDAPDLLASAPVPASLVRRGKLEAVAALAIGLVALPFAALVAVSPAAAAVAAFYGAFAVGSAVSLQLWHGAPARRSRFAARNRESRLMGLVETAMSLLFGLGATLGVLFSPWALAPPALIVALLLWLRPRPGTRLPADRPTA